MDSTAFSPPLKINIVLGGRGKSGNCPKTFVEDCLKKGCIQNCCQVRVCWLIFTTKVPEEVKNALQLRRAGVTKDCESGGLRYSEQPTVLTHSSQLFKGKYLQTEVTFNETVCKNHNKRFFPILRRAFWVEHTSGCVVFNSAPPTNSQKNIKSRAYYLKIAEHCWKTNSSVCTCERNVSYRFSICYITQQAIYRDSFINYTTRKGVFMDENCPWELLRLSTTACVTHW